MGMNALILLMSVLLESLFSYSNNPFRFLIFSSHAGRVGAGGKGEPSTPFPHPHDRQGGKFHLPL